MGKITTYMKESQEWANNTYGTTSTEQYSMPGVIYSQSAHSHQFKLQAGLGFTTVASVDSHQHPIVDGIIRPANNHTHTIKDLFTNKVDFIESLKDGDSLKFYMSRNA